MFAILWDVNFFSLYKMAKQGEQNEPFKGN